MAKFVPKEKMSKKARKELVAQRRATWEFSPITKKVESKKLYNRNKKSHAGRDDYGMGFCYIAPYAVRRLQFKLSARQFFEPDAQEALATAS